MLSAIGLAAWIGSNRTPADGTRPLELEHGDRIAATSSETIVLGTYNIHGGEGIDNVLDLKRIAENLRGVDFAGLYEVHAGYASHQGSEIAEQLELATAFAATERRWWHDHFGNAILTRLPLRGLHRIPLPGTQGKKFRNAVLANLEWGPTTLHVLAVHLDRVQDRERQLQQVIDLFNSLESPAVLMGDLNTTRDDPQLSALLAKPQVQDALEAVGLEESAPRIDWMIFKGMQCQDAQLIASPASDHPAVIARFGR
jgi:endonuclease/exonuclease/phosphatase family metal-dependent hydrolase